MSANHKVVVECVGRNHKGPVWSAWLVRSPEVSEILCASRRDPEHDAARVLHEHGHRGRVEFYKVDRSTPYLYGTIEWMAKRAVYENPRTGLHVVKWQPYSGPTRDDEEADGPEVA